MKKRKRQQTIERIKKTKEFARRKARKTGEPDDDDDWIANQIADDKARPAPGQLENCEICGKRFTVTSYSKAGPEGGLLCADCSKKQVKGDGKKAPAKKRVSGPSRRQNKTKLLDGETPHGAQSLLEMCIKKVAESIDDVEEFGDLPPPVMHRLSQILSKRRAVTPRILNLFLRRNHRELNIYDCAQLQTDDYHRILALMPDLIKLNLRFVTPMKDNIFDYMVENNKSIRDLHLRAPNLVTDDCWRRFFIKMGPRLQSLKLWDLDAAFDNKTAEVMCENCTGLERLKLQHIVKIGDETLTAISSLKALKHLSLWFSQDTKPEPLLKIISSVGPNLRTLSLQEFKNADDTLLQSIHDHCRSLTKLRFTNNDLCTDQALTSLFRDWSNPPLTYVDFYALRDVDMSNPAGPPEPIGLASNGFIALMEHSGSKIQSLSIASCRHISRDAFETVFDENKRYPHLKNFDISFTGPVDDYIAQCIVRCCPALTKLVAFGCFNIRDLKVNMGVAVIGTVSEPTFKGIAQAETM